MQSENAIPAPSLDLTNALPSAEQRRVAMLAHAVTALGFFSFLFSAAATGALYFMYRGESEFVERHAKESLNLNLVLSLISCVAMGLTLVSTVGGSIAHQFDLAYGLILLGLVGTLSTCIWIATVIVGGIIAWKGGKSALNGGSYKLPGFIPRLPGLR